MATLSESETLGRVVQDLRAAITDVRGGHAEHALAALRRCIDTLMLLQRQAQRGYHRNPGLVIYGNPPRGKLQVARYMGKGSVGTRRGWEVEGVISEEVHAITYVHHDDGKPYKHDFVNPTTLLAITRGDRKDVLITSPDGFPIWQDFD